MEKTVNQETGQDVYSIVGTSVGTEGTERQQELTWITEGKESRKTKEEAKQAVRECLQELSEVILRMKNKYMC